MGGWVLMCYSLNQISKSQIRLSLLLRLLDLTCICFSVCMIFYVCLCVCVRVCPQRLSVLSASWSGYCFHPSLSRMHHGRHLTTVNGSLTKIQCVYQCKLFWINQRIFGRQHIKLEAVKGDDDGNTKQKKQNKKSLYVISEYKTCGPSVICFTLHCCSFLQLSMLPATIVANDILHCEMFWKSLSRQVMTRLNALIFPALDADSWASCFARSKVD